jgi:hypothetical protein
LLKGGLLVGKSSTSIDGNASFLSVNNEVNIKKPNRRTSSITY